LPEIIVFAASFGNKNDETFEIKENREEERERPKQKERKQELKESSEGYNLEKKSTKIKTISPPINRVKLTMLNLGYRFSHYHLSSILYHL